VDHYDIYRGSTAHFSQATQITTTTQLTYLDTEGDPEIDQYYWLRAIDSSGFASQAGAHFALPAIAPRPDLMIGKRYTALRYDDTYMDQQRQNTVLRGRREARLALASESDGLPEQIRIAGRKGNRTCELRYYRLSGGRSNITAGVVRGSYLASAEHELQQVEIKPKRAIKKRSRFRLAGASRSQSALFDKVEIQVRRK
jgi:hypothetical protein